MDSEPSKKFLITYPYRGHEWCVVVHADSEREAEERLSAICIKGEVRGQVFAEVPSIIGAAMWPFMWLWLRLLNAFRGGTHGQ
ncbi:hypothetical protein J2792_002304 [Novosphingobium capsulatum]|uniref:Uncharacterized protein n=1 Tax=Novosphingobium capsulatum TaxID=13688 RepID=A0ABU1MND0_9SPHN|nr:hypothetical protein [Novosphingobium capsulatum]MDR6511432.1 hypothetical protein [Novosphingobium capsulatum]